MDFSSMRLSVYPQRERRIKAGGNGMRSRLSGAGDPDYSDRLRAMLPLPPTLPARRGLRFRQ